MLPPLFPGPACLCACVPVCLCACIVWHGPLCEHPTAHAPLLLCLPQLLAEQAALPAGWKKEKDPETGEVFYWHIASDTTQWDPPTEATPTPAPRAGAGAGGPKRKPRAVIVAESYDTAGADFELKTYPKSDASKATIVAALRNAGFLFSALAPQELDAMAMAMQEMRLTKGDVIIKQGDTGDNFYVVESGDFDIYVNGNKVASRGAGTSFGELALLYNSPRNATVQAANNCHVWALDRLTFRHMIASTREDHVGAIVSSLRRVSLLEPLTDEQLNRVADAVRIMEYKPDVRFVRLFVCVCVCLFVVAVGGVSHDGPPHCVFPLAGRHHPQRRRR